VITFSLVRARIQSMNLKSAAFLAAPVLTFVYGGLRLLDGLDGEHGPGFAWTAGHLAFIAALALFVSIFWTLRGMVGRGVVATVLTGLGFVGVAALFVQFSIDLVVGFLSADHAAMSARFEVIQAVPGVQAVVYDIVPMLLYVALLALIVQLAAQRRVKLWIALLTLGGLLIPVAGKDLMPLAAICMLIAFLPITRQLAAASPAQA
jgi:hypothetical protein